MFPMTLTITLHNTRQLDVVLSALRDEEMPAVRVEEAAKAAKAAAERINAMVSTWCEDGSPVREAEPVAKATKPAAKAAVKAVANAAQAEEPEVKKAKPVEEPPSTGTTNESEASDAQSDIGASDGGKTYTLEDAKELTKRAVAGGKRPEMVELLQRYGVRQASGLLPEQVADFCREAEGLLS